MKINKLLLLPLLAPLAGYAQTGNPLTTSPVLVQPGKTVELTYNPAGTKLEKAKDIKGVVYLFNKKQAYYAEDLTFTQAGNVLKATLAIPDTIVLAAMRLSDGKTTDNNSEKGYLIPVVDSDGKPVEGEIITEAAIRQGIGSMLMISKMDKAEAARLYEKELIAYPAKRIELLGTYYSLLVATKQTQKAARLKPEVMALFKNAKAFETDLSSAVNAFYDSSRPVYDSLKKVMLQRFPKGLTARFAAQSLIIKETDLDKKEELYKAFVDNFNPPPAVQSSILYNLASAYAEKKDYAKVDQIITQMPEKYNVPGLYNSIAWPLAEKGVNLDLAANYSKKSLDMVDNFKTNPPSYFSMYPPSARPAMIASSWNSYADTYALILYKQGKVAEALNIQEKAMTPGSSPDMQERLVTFLNANSKHKEAFEKAETAVKEGKASAKMKQELKIAYTKTKGSDAGYDAYLTALQTAADTKVRTEILKKMLNKQATGFALKNLEGKEISLASLKGKVVVVDFWATWCGPCKASFPGMQKMVTKYKDNPNVAFVFVDTWETDPKREALVTKFIADNKYSFNVLYDTEKKEEKGKYTVVDQFGVDGIPTKFVVDKTGVIRFKSVGYNGSDDALVSELSTMIDIASNPPAQSGGAE